jgi:YfiH family protein
MRPHPWIVPDWPAPARVRAFATTRQGGVSDGEYATLNLGAGSGDDPARVARNRDRLHEHLPEAPQWPAQRHGIDVVRLGERRLETAPVADAVVTGAARRVCSVLTADCMPLLLCDESGTQVGAVHAGWRGLSAGVIERAVQAMGVVPGTLLAWMGPTIGQSAFEVGPEVRAAFVDADAAAADAFVPGQPGKFHADLYHLARLRLRSAGVARVHGGGYCTFNEHERFFSYRREKKSGRMGVFIWLE